MRKMKRLLAVILTLAVLLSIAIVSASAATVDSAKSGNSTGITIHYYSESGVPNIYYWNSLPSNIETTYPGPAMTAEGNNWYKYTFSDKTKINLMFVTKGEQ